MFTILSAAFRHLRRPVIGGAPAPARRPHAHLARCMLLLVPLAGCGGESAPAVVMDGVHLACDAPRKDFGQVWEGAVLEHEFAFEVQGNEPLVVEAVRADCGCTAAELLELDGDERKVVAPGRPIAPGTRLALGVTYDTHGKAGAGERLVKLFCNLPDGVFPVAVEAEVRKRFRTEPDPPPSMQFAAGSEAETRFDVVGVLDRPFRLRHEPRGLPSSVVATLEPQDPDAEGRATRWHVHVHCGPDTPRGTHTYPIYMEVPDWSPVVDGDGVDEVTGGQKQVFSPFVVVRVEGRFTRQPASLTFGAVGTQETVSRTVRLTCNDPSFELVEPEVTIETLVADRSLAWADRATLDVRAVEGERAFDIELLLEGLSPQTERTFLGKLVVRTGHPEEPVIDVNVQGFRADGGPR